MKHRLLRIAKLLAFPFFYVLCLAFFGYLKFPYGRLRDRVIAEFERHAKPGQRLEIGKLGSYWFTGVEVANVKLHLPAEEPSAPAFPGAGDFGGASAAPKEAVLTIDEAHARVRILPLLIGRVRMDFWASAFGGEITGSAPVGNAKGGVELALDHVDIGKIEILSQLLPVPLHGVATSKLELDAPDGKINKANGTFDLTISEVVVSDAKTKIAGLLELPPAKLGDLVLVAEAKDGVLKISKLAATGVDLEIVGDGKITLREPWTEAQADLFLRFKFTDAYRAKSSATKALLGEPGTNNHGLMESQVPKMSKARRPDGFYGWHIFGPLKKLRYEPAANEPGAPAAVTGAPATGRRPFRASGAVEGPAGATPPPPPAGIPAVLPPGGPPQRRAIPGAVGPIQVPSATPVAVPEPPPPPPPPPAAEPAPAAPPEPPPADPNAPPPEAPPP